MPHRLPHSMLCIVRPCTAGVHGGEGASEGMQEITLLPLLCRLNRCLMQ